MATYPTFDAFPKIARLNRPIIVTEKIDGTNATVLITEDGDMLAGSRTRWITAQDDNYGFAKWVEGNRDLLLQLGPGLHRGEWWGSGIQRGYNLPKGEKRFSLFNTSRWCNYNEIEPLTTTDALGQVSTAQRVPEGLYVVPLLFTADSFTATLHGYNRVEHIIEVLREYGSQAAPGFMNPEGIIAFHTAANVFFKVTCKDDGIPKTLANKQ